MSIDTSEAITTTRTVYVTANPDRPPQGYTGRHRQPDPKRAAATAVDLDTLLTASVTA